MSLLHEQTNARLLARFGGAVTLSRTVPGTPSEEEPWLPVDPTITTESLQFIATAAGAEWISTGVILAGDLTGIMEVPQTINPPLPGDEITADGKVYGILRADPVHSDPGDVIHFAIHGRI